ncbi:uncharacterized protein [Halyomorpha halys]|uniref:uncharacterized protein n=1 Tax=Halyomorpha halys TaxID=286706 RepID=UPI0006D501D6|nr:uncharacterized protein LOC106684792 [Halyomorpha halys]
MFKLFKNSKCIAVWAGIFISLFMLSSKRYIVTFDGVVNGVQPLVVWEYVMDFNNMKGLNPTIKDFSILSDTNVGNPFDWQYQVKYTETLHQLPFIWNEAIATYDFKTISEKEFEIISKHTTCFFLGTYCVKTFSKFLFQQHKDSPSDTYCEEDVNYECPRILSHFCYNEVIYQRKSIFQNLQKKFTLK